MVMNMIIPKRNVFSCVAYVFFFNKSVEHISVTCSTIFGSKIVSMNVNAENRIKSKLISFQSSGFVAFGNRLRAATIFSCDFSIIVAKSKSYSSKKSSSNLTALHCTSKAVKCSTHLPMIRRRSFVSSYRKIHNFSG